MQASKLQRVRQWLVPVFLTGPRVGSAWARVRVLPAKPPARPLLHLDPSSSKNLRQRRHCVVPLGTHSSRIEPATPLSGSPHTRRETASSSLSHPPCRSMILHIRNAHHRQYLHALNPSRQSPSRRSIILAAIRS